MLTSIPDDSVESFVSLRVTSRKCLMCPAKIMRFELVSLDESSSCPYVSDLSFVTRFLTMCAILSSCYELLLFYWFSLSSLHTSICCLHVIYAGLPQATWYLKRDISKLRTRVRDKPCVVPVVCFLCCSVSPVKYRRWKREVNYCKFVPKIEYAQNLIVFR